MGKLSLLFVFAIFTFAVFAVVFFFLKSKQMLYHLNPRLILNSYNLKLLTHTNNVADGCLAVFPVLPRC